MAHTIVADQKGLSTMLAVDFRRMFTSRMLYIFLASCLVIPILILTMTSGFGGTEEAGMSFTNVWQIISSESGSMSMDMTAMCNMNLVYFAMAVFVGLFISDDFRSGYAKNLFTVRAKKGNYAASKTIVSFVAGAMMLLLFFVGAMLGGRFSGLSFALGSASVFSIILCLASKIFLMAVFVAIYVTMSVFAKSRAWLSICGGFMAGMLMFMMIPMMTPLNATILHAGMCAMGGVLFSLGLGYVSKVILQSRDIL